MKKLRTWSHLRQPQQFWTATKKPFTSRVNFCELPWLSMFYNHICFWFLPIFVKTALENKRKEKNTFFLAISLSLTFFTIAHSLPDQLDVCQVVHYQVSFSRCDMPTSCISYQRTTMTIELHHFQDKKCLFILSSHFPSKKQACQISGLTNTYAQVKIESSPPSFGVNKTSPTKNIWKPCMDDIKLSQV